MRSNVERVLNAQQGASAEVREDAEHGNAESVLELCDAIGEQRRITPKTIEDHSADGLS